MAAVKCVRGGSIPAMSPRSTRAADGSHSVVGLRAACLILAASELPRLVPEIDLAHALRLVTRDPGEATGPADRGEIAPGKRADVVRVRVALDRPGCASVWRAGLRVT